MGSCAGNKQDGPSPDRTRRRRFCRSMDYVSKVGSTDWEQCARTRQKGEAEEQVVIEVDGWQAAGDGRDRRKGMKYWRRVCGECCGQTRTHSAKNSRIRREVTSRPCLGGDRGVVVNGLSSMWIWMDHGHFSGVIVGSCRAGPQHLKRARNVVGVYMCTHRALGPVLVVCAGARAAGRRGAR